MTDERTRAAERRSQQTGALEDEAAILANRLRAGSIRPDLLRLAAILGHAPAALALGDPEPVEITGDLRGWIRRLAPWGARVSVRAAVVAVRTALEVLSPDARAGEHGDSIEAALRAAERCLSGAPVESVSDRDVRSAVFRFAVRGSEPVRTVALSAYAALQAAALPESRRVDERAADRAGRAVEAAGNVVSVNVVVQAIQRELLPLALADEPVADVQYREPLPPVAFDPSPFATRPLPVVRPDELAAWQATCELAANRESWGGGPLFGAEVLLAGPQSEGRFHAIWAALFDDEALTGPFDDHALTRLETAVPWPNGEDFASEHVLSSGRYAALSVEGHGFALARPGISVRRGTDEIRALLWVPPPSIRAITGDSTPFMRWNESLSVGVSVQALHDAVLGYVLRLRRRLPIICAEVREEVWPGIGRECRDRLPTGAVVVLRTLSSRGEPLNDIFNVITS